MFPREEIFIAISNLKLEKRRLLSLNCTQQLSLVEGQDDRACQHKSASKPMMPR
jgi:hypothetical protein